MFFFRASTVVGRTVLTVCMRGAYPTWASNAGIMHGASINGTHTHTAGVMPYGLDDWTPPGLYTEEVLFLATCEAP